MGSAPVGDVSQHAAIIRQQLEHFAGVHLVNLSRRADDGDRAIGSQRVETLIGTRPLHKLGHAYAVKRWGGEVHEMGVMLLVFTPVPYVDATASTAFPDKRRRMNAVLIDSV